MATSQEVLLAAMDRLSLQNSELIMVLDELLQQQRQPVTVEAPDFTDVVNAVQGLKGPASPDEIALALAKVLRFPESPDLSGVLGEITESLKKLDFRLQGQGAAYGPSGPSNIVSDATRKIGEVERIAQPVTTNATIKNFPAERIYDAATALTSVDAGATYITALSFTPATDIRIEGYNADFQALVTGAAYRMRLITGTDASPTIWHGEEVATTQNSWVPFRINITPGTRIGVQMIHDQLTAQSVRATINYSRLP